MDEKPKERKYFFQKGNKFGKGRPKVSLTKPDVLLPAIFQNAGINWAVDFTRLYRAHKERELTKTEKERFRLLMELMPYLIVKMQLKEGDLKKFMDQSSSVKQAQLTDELLKSLEADSNGPQAKGNGSQGSMEQGGVVLPPSSEPTTDL